MSNLSSYEKINYSLRPAKNIERKMLCDAFRRLSYIQKVEKYRYIGFGSTYFSDFNLIHRNLGITNLISIEKDLNNKKRFEFNKPFSCIDMKFGSSSAVLPSLDWSKLSIVWVDYDSKLDDSMLEDINTIVFNITPGSIFLITVDVKPDLDKELLQKPDTLKVLRFEKLKKRINILKIPSGCEDINLDHKENPKVIYKIINDQIIEILSKKNGGLVKGKKTEYKQLFHFIYNDGTPMLTVGGIIFEEKQKKIIEAMQFEDLGFIEGGSRPFVIEIPKLTFKEINALDSLLPHHINNKTGSINTTKTKQKNVPKLSKDDIIKYSKVYRYFPNFAEASF